MSHEVRIFAFRIVKRKLAGHAFSGEGARRFGGRWNSVGTRMVYTAGSVALALLEWRVHLAQWPPPDIMVIPVGIETSLVWSPSRLPSDWKRYPAPPSTAAVGDRWIKSGRSVVMRVPSVVVPSEWNYLLNPNHPAFPRLVIGRTAKLIPDARLGPLS